MRPLIEITIPVLNEEATIYEQVHKVFKYLNEHSDFANFVIVIADNGSTDSTPTIVTSLSSELHSIRTIRLEERGVGRALKASWQTSEADVVGYMDLDLATDLIYLKPALQKLLSEGFDIVTGSRLAKGSKVIGRSFVRGISSFCFNAIVKILFRTSFSDGMCGFKFVRRKKLNDLLKFGADNDGWFFATEILIVGEHLGYKLYDLPVKWTDDPNSKVKIGKLAVEYLKSMFRLRRKLSSQKGTV
ncbi:MAG: glycosyltransferase [Gammaproteobacteria bacterium]|nr:glycosyltransferase [Gammaproteobacteria bacterium]